MNDEIKNNLSTIAVWIYVIVAPYISQYITQDQFATLVVAIVGLCIAIYSSANPNTMKSLGNDKDVCTCNEETVMNDEYEVDPVEE